jgi:predicted enzyme related to lactoylglutathione lyase
MANALTWFEIPTQDLDRAVRFYETVLGVRLRREVFGGVPHALFPVGETDIGGALIHDDHRKPSLGGTLVYLDAAGKLDACVERVRGAGGTLLMPKTAIGEYGFIAVLGDTEGNSVALHSPRAG